MAERFRVGRVVLVGDAAHVRPPWGGLGMNAGIGDAHNLAWKLAEVVAGAPHVDVQDAGTLRSITDLGSPHGGWADLYGDAPDGAVLARPDGHVAWRSAGMPDDPPSAVRDALTRVLGLDGAAISRPAGRQPGSGTPPRGAQRRIVITMSATVLDRNSGVPLYRQIKRILVEEIRQSPDTGPLMTEEELIRRFRVSRAPVRQALRELTDEGIVYRERAKGTFPVRRATIERPATLQFGGLVGYLAEQGLEPVNRVSGVQRVAPPTKVAAALQLAPDEQVLTFFRSVIVDERPLSSARIYLNSPEEFAPTAAELEESGSGIALLEAQYGIVLQRSEHHVWAALAEEADAHDLETDVGSAMLVLETVFFTREGQPAAWRRAIQRAGEFTYIFTSTSPSA